MLMMKDFVSFCISYFFIFIKFLSTYIFIFTYIHIHIYINIYNICVYNRQYISDILREVFCIKIVTLNMLIILKYFIFIYKMKI